MQSKHILRTNRSATIKLRVEAIKNGSIPKSIKRGIAPAASVVCRVDRTRWPVIAAWTAISAVSASLISPTKIISGSCRTIERKPEAKETPVSLLT